MTQNNSSDWTVGLTRRLFRYIPKDGEDDDYTIRTPPDPLCKIQIVHLPSEGETNSSSPSIVWRLGAYNTVFVKQYTSNKEALPLEFVKRLMADRDQTNSIRGTVEIDTRNANETTLAEVRGLISEFRCTDVPRQQKPCRVKFDFANNVISNDVFDIYTRDGWYFGVTNQHLIASANDVGVPQLTRTLRVPYDLVPYDVHKKGESDWSRFEAKTYVWTKFYICYRTDIMLTIRDFAHKFVTINATEELYEKKLCDLSLDDRVKIAPPDRCFVAPVETRVFGDDDLFMSPAVDSSLKLAWTDSAFLRWPYWHTMISDIVIALYHLPAYVLLEIIDQIPWAVRQSHRQKIELIMSLQRSIRSLRPIDDNE